MLADSGPILVILLWSAAGFGTAFSGLIPISAGAPEFFSRPFWYGFRAILGDFDLMTTYELLGDSFTPGQNIMGTVAILMLFIYAFFTTIYIVNLMIAQMTTQYEEIRGRSTLFRKFRRVGTIVEFKDLRSLLPPPFNVLLLPLYFGSSAYRCCCQPASTTEPKKEYGFSHLMWQVRSHGHRSNQRPTPPHRSLRQRCGPSLSCPPSLPPKALGVRRRLTASPLPAAPHVRRGPSTTCSRSNEPHATSTSPRPRHTTRRRRSPRSSTCSPLRSAWRASCNAISSTPPADLIAWRPR